jgi:hypothetical protein
MRIVIEEKIKTRCLVCNRVFRERPNKVRDGVQLNCQNCNKLITLNRDTEDPFIRRALKAAKVVREAQQDALIQANYNPGNSDKPCA